MMDFLTSLKLGNSITKSCEKAGISRRSVYYWKSEDDEFSEAWDDAVASSNEELEDELRSRALDRSDTKSHILLIFLLKKINPEYKENYKPETKKLREKTPEFEFSPEEVDAAIEILKSAKKDHE